MVNQFGMGTSIRSRNDTPAAWRAVHDALHHSSIVLKSFGYGHRDMRVQVTIGVQAPGVVQKHCRRRCPRWTACGGAFAATDG